MFILVKYGNNETLLCNPSCAVINLLTNIKRRAGYGNSNVTVDLSDETGAYYFYLKNKSKNCFKNILKEFLTVMKIISFHFTSDMVCQLTVLCDTPLKI